MTRYHKLKKSARPSSSSPSNSSSRDPSRQQHKPKKISDKIVTKQYSKRSSPSSKHRKEDEKTKKPRHIDKETSELTPCGCPFNCQSEIARLRIEVSSLESQLNDHHNAQNEPLSSLTKLLDSAENQSQLLQQAWSSIGSKRLRTLIPPDLLSICSRREQRNKSSTSSNTPPKCPPDQNSSADSACGLAELWTRCLDELNELAALPLNCDNKLLLGVLNGSFEGADKPDLPPVNIKQRLLSSLGSTNESNTSNGDHNNKRVASQAELEIMEEELRNRALRSIDKAKE